MLRKMTMILAPVLALTANGCGKADDVARAMGGTQNKATLMATRMAARQVRLAQTRAVQFARQQMNAALFETGARSSCGSATTTDELGTCSVSTCDSATSSLTANCILSGQTVSCGGESYTVSNGTFGFTFAISSSTISMSMNMSADVKGGDLDGKVECRFARTFNLASIDQETGGVSCSDFNCKYAGSTIDCEDMQKEMGEVGQCS